MKKIASYILKKVLRFEHIVYCFTNCKVELPLHRLVYRHRKEEYDEYCYRQSMLYPLFNINNEL